MTIYVFYILMQICHFFEKLYIIQVNNVHTIGTAQYVQLLFEKITVFYLKWM